MIDQSNNLNKDKVKSQRSLSLKETKERRKNMAIKVLSFNIQSNKLSQTKKHYLKLLSLEAKWFYNYLVYLSQINIVNDYGDLIYPHNLFTFNTKSNWINVYTYDKELNNYIYVDYELKVLSSQMKQEILKRIQSSIKSMIEKQKKNKLNKSKNTKIGQLKFKSFVNIPLKQFNNSFYLSDNCKKLSLQGNKKLTFHLIRNKNLNHLSKTLGLNNSSGNKLNKVSLSKLISSKHIEIANAEIQYNPNKEQYIFNLTIYFNKESLKQANLFQGTQLNHHDKNFISSLTVGIDCGISNELTVNVGDIYQSVSLDTKINSKKLKGLKKYQKRMNKHISKSKKLNAKDNLDKNNSNKPIYKSKKFKELKRNLNRIQNNIINHKKDTVNKIVSLLDNFKQISFQKELIHTWHKNKTFHFSKIVQHGIRGKIYAKWKYKYLQQEEFNKKNLDNSTVNKIVKYKQIESKERTTKNCICGKTNHITLKDRVYTCRHNNCGYKNNRDTHSSYYINHFNIVNNKLSSKIISDSGIESEDKANYRNIDKLYSNSEKKITSSDTEKSTTEMFYALCKAKLNSKTLTITLNKFNLETVDKPTQEASPFMAG